MFASDVHDEAQAAALINANPALILELFRCLNVEHFRSLLSIYTAPPMRLDDFASQSLGAIAASGFPGDFGRGYQPRVDGLGLNYSLFVMRKGLSGTLLRGLAAEFAAAVGITEEEALRLLLLHEGGKPAAIDAPGVMFALALKKALDGGLEYCAVADALLWTAADLTAACTKTPHLPLLVAFLLGSHAANLSVDAKAALISHMNGKKLPPGAITAGLASTGARIAVTPGMNGQNAPRPTTVFASGGASSMAPAAGGAGAAAAPSTPPSGTAAFGSPNPTFSLGGKGGKRGGWGQDCCVGILLGGADTTAPVLPLNTQQRGEGRAPVAFSVRGSWYYTGRPGGGNCEFF